MDHQSIKNWAPDDRPREKLLQFGPSTLSVSELIAILLRTGAKNKTAVDIAREVGNLSKNDLGRLGRLGVKDLMTIKGIGKAKAVTLSAALELGRRRQSTPPQPSTPITSTEDVVHFLQPLLKDHSFEVVIVLFLNQANIVKHVEWMSKGGLDRAIIDVRVIVRKALEEFCSAIILCHNHPSGSLRPSKADIFSTAKVQKAAAAFDIQLLDHLIVSEQGYFSFANEGYITPL